MQTRLGSGKRFATLKQKLAAKGNRRFQRLAEKGHKRAMSAAPLTWPAVLKLDAEPFKPLLAIGQNRPSQIEGKPVHYRTKRAATVGDWWHRGERKPFRLSTKDIDEVVSTFKARRAAGIRPMLLDRHTESPTADMNYGYVEDLKREGDGLFAEVSLIGDKAIELAARNDVSVYILPDSIDANGNKYGATLHHLSLTPDPALPNLGPFVKIAASAGGSPADVPVYELAAATETHMLKPETITKLRAKYPELKEVADGDLAETIAADALEDSGEPAPDVTALSAQVQTLTRERDEAKSALALSAAPKEPDALSLSLITESFETKRAKAIESGVISEAGMKAIDKLMMPNGKPSVLALSCGAGDTRPIYARLCEIIAGNPGIQTGNARKRSEALGLSAATPPVHGNVEESPETDPAKQRDEGRAQAQQWQAQQAAARGFATAK